MDGSAEERQNLLIGRKRSGAGAMTSARRKGEFPVLGISRTFPKLRCLAS